LQLNIKRCPWTGYVGRAPDNTGIMFLSEVALGKIHEINRDDPSLRRAPDGYDSIVARGMFPSYLHKGFY